METTFFWLPSLALSLSLSSLSRSPSLSLSLQQATSSTTSSLNPKPQTASTNFYQHLSCRREGVDGGGHLCDLQRAQAAKWLKVQGFGLWGLHTRTPKNPKYENDGPLACFRGLQAIIPTSAVPVRPTRFKVCSGFWGFDGRSQNKGF